MLIPWIRTRVSAVRFIEIVQKGMIAHTRTECVYKANEYRVPSTHTQTHTALCEKRTAAINMVVVANGGEN